MQAAAGQGATALVLGEAGIGKSSLLKEFAAGLGAGYQVLQGGCEDLFTPRALGPLRDMAPLLGDGLADLLDGEAGSDRLFPRLLAWLAGAPATTVLLVEDVHWADQATLDLLKYLARRVAGMRVLLLASVRSDELMAGHPFWRWVGDLPPSCTRRIALQPLSPRAVAQLATAAGRDADELYRITSGNPFFVTELLAAAGLILPGVTRILPSLTALAAAGLMIVMGSATTLHIIRGETGSAISAAVLFVLVKLVAYARWKVVPIAPRTRT